MKTKILRSLLLLLSGLGPSLSSQAGQALEMTEGAPLYLEVGEQRMLPIQNLTHYSVSGNSIHYVRLPDKNQILVKAIRPGIATLFTEDSSLQKRTRLIRIEQKKNLKLNPNLLQSLNHLQSTEVIHHGSHFILKGTIRDLKEAQTIAYLRTQYSEIKDETDIEANWLDDSEQKLRKLIQAYPGLTLRRELGSLFLEGGCTHPASLELLRKSVMTIQPLTHLDLQTLKDNTPTLYFKVFLLEVKKEQFSSLGVEWPESQAAGLHVTPLQSVFTQPIDLTLHTLSQTGAVKILSSPELVVRAPGQAELFAGGELPIRQKSKFNDSVIWKNVGLSLKLDVKEYGGEKVRLNVETEISHLDANLSNDNIPGIQSNRIKTQVDAVMGKPLLLSGLLQDDFKSRMKGLPALSQIPVLGKLFSSEDFQNDRSELAAVLLPHREAPAHPLERISRELPRGFVPIPRNYLTADEIDQAKKNAHYPWNVL